MNATMRKAVAVLVGGLAPLAGGWLGYHACSRWQAARPDRTDFGAITEAPLGLVTAALVGFVVGAIVGLVLAGRLWPDDRDDRE